MINLLNYNQAKLAEYFKSIGEKPFRAKQLMRWMHHFGVHDFTQMTDIAKSLREKLMVEAEITLPNVQLEPVSYTHLAACKVAGFPAILAETSL